MTVPNEDLGRMARIVTRVLRDLDRIKYELEIVKDIEEAARLVRRAKKCMSALSLDLHHQGT